MMTAAKLSSNITPPNHIQPHPKPFPYIMS